MLRVEGGYSYNFYIRGIEVDNSLKRKYIYRDRILILRINKSKKDKHFNYIFTKCKVIRRKKR